ncbi:MAG: MG2 domain-containing protein, partial [Planctomycetota bacterium]|nr:MG2 domain-containing protein [Planctomycetota bacterium]
AKLATGIKRFELPKDYNFIKIYEDIVENPATGHAENALTQLAQIHEDRRQYVKAAQYWQQNIETYGPGNKAWKQKRLDQIVQNWGRFEGSRNVPAGAPAVLDYRYRNGTSIALTAERIDLNSLVKDAIEHVNSKPGRIDWNRVNVTNIGYRLIEGDGAKYIKEVVANWDKQVKPRKDHYDSRVTIKAPFKEAGAYLITAKMMGGNTSKIVLWISDTVIVRKPMSDKSLYFVADAVTGKPVPAATVKFFGYKQVYKPKTVNGRRIRNYEIETREFTSTTDKNGQVVVPKSKLESQFQWLVQATTESGRNAFYGFQGIWHGRMHDQIYNQVKTFVVTDRPVYRPNQKVQFKIWSRHAQYDKENISQFAGATISYKILNPKGETLATQSLKANQYGGINGEFSIPSDAMLGQYTIRCNNGAIGGNTFRIEEYKKPEFEVSVEAPTEPVQLGDKIKATIKADYFFGGPVTNATVKYTITRQEHTEKWFPTATWDWCYGPGYWWFGYDTPWFPGFRGWCGCFRPGPWWHHQSINPPEVVAVREVQIGDQGTIEVEIDTAIAKELHGNQNHQYSISAEVRDSSRRTIIGSGQVLVAQKPFKIFTWLNRGYYQTGDVVRANFKAQTLDKKPVQGKGVLKLFKVSYDENQQPVEKEVASWKIDTNEEGTATQQARPTQPGQYRFAYTLTDSANHRIEGGYVFTVIGERFTSSRYRFNDLELIPEKREYQPGETVKLQLNTNQKDGSVLLFVRPANGIYLPPRLLKLEGKSTVIELEVNKKDMPNFYVEALTVANGNVFNETKEIVVPPEKRILNVEVKPSNGHYRPGQKAKVQVHVTDHTGENFVGDLALSVYDKSVEYISGGSNTPEIKDFFW